MELKRQPNPSLSLVVPVYNEELAVPLFLEAVEKELGALPNKIEIVFVNDGSRDNTVPVILSKMDSVTFATIRCIGLSRNFGKEAALSAGIDAALGDVVVPMDVDLQDPPAVVRQFLEKWAEGYDVVYGVRASRAEGAAKKATASLFYKLFNRLSSLKIPENVGDFRLMDRRVVDVLKSLPERNRFMKGIFAWVGFKSVGVPYERTQRSAGETKWNYWKLWNFALDGITSFSTLPLRMWTYVGMLFAFLAFLYMSFIIIRVMVQGVDLPGYPSLICVILFLGGIQLITLGVIGEYIGRLFVETKGRPVYIVDRVYDKDSER